MYRMPLLIKGEKLAEQATKGLSGGLKDYPYTYEEAKKRILLDIDKIMNYIPEHEEYFLSNQYFLSVRLNEGFLAKSYVPTLFKKECMEIVGARIYNRRIDEKGKVQKSKLYFLRCSKANLEWFKLNLLENKFNQNEKLQLRSMEAINFLSWSEKIFGLDSQDSYSDVEIVLHPIDGDIEQVQNILDTILSGGYELKRYDHGPIFILGKLKQMEVEKIASYNFLRSIHPSPSVNLTPSIKKSIIRNLPRVPQGMSKSKLTIGVFDGGIIPNNKYLKPFVEQIDLSSEPLSDECLIHGSQVCSSLLYGDISTLSEDSELPIPSFKVECFRVLPEQNWYKVIDNIEKIVSEKDYINVFNISFGPRGPIFDDEIDRFTYALDKMAYKGKLFIIAAGNDGEVAEPFNRIQVPSDSINNITVGAFSIINGIKQRAPYSCIGDGREGGKVKPDLLAFGGSEGNEFHVIDHTGLERVLSSGTSLSTPLVTKTIGDLLARSKDLTPRILRTLLIHTAVPLNMHAKEEGFGLVADDIDSILNCNETTVTILYEGYIYPKKAIKLPIPLPDAKKFTQNSSITFKWTISTVATVDMADSDLYSKECIEYTFYPNSDMYSFTKKGCKPIKVDISKDSELMNQLIKDGYKQSKNPVSDSKKSRTEGELRKNEKKWDTIIRDQISKRCSSIKEPFLIISGLSRDDINTLKIPFCVALTVSNPKYESNLYADIQSTYKELVPLELESEIENKENEYKN